MANGSSAARAIPRLFQIPELKEKILFTLMCLAIYRLGSHITTPGVNLRALEQLAGQFQGTLFGIYDMFVGGGLQRATILALGIMPYISASILFQLLAAVFPTIEKLQKHEGEEGRRKLTQWTRYTAILLSIMQSYGYSIFLESQPGAVIEPGWVRGLPYSTYPTRPVHLGKNVPKAPSSERMPRSAAMLPWALV